MSLSPKETLYPIRWSLPATFSSRPAVSTHLLASSVALTALDDPGTGTCQGVRHLDEWLFLLCFTLPRIFLRFVDVVVVSFAFDLLVPWLLFLCRIWTRDLTVFFFSGWSSFGIESPSFSDRMGCQHCYALNCGLLGALLGLCWFCWPLWHTCAVSLSGVWYLSMSRKQIFDCFCLHPLYGNSLLLVFYELQC